MLLELSAFCLGLGSQNLPHPTPTKLGWAPGSKGIRKDSRGSLQIPAAQLTRSCSGGAHTRFWPSAAESSLKRPVPSPPRSHWLPMWQGSRNRTTTAPRRVEDVGTPMVASPLSLGVELRQLCPWSCPGLCYRKWRAPPSQGPSRPQALRAEEAGWAGRQVWVVCLRPSLEPMPAPSGSYRGPFP